MSRRVGSYGFGSYRATQIKTPSAGLSRTSPHLPAVLSNNPLVDTLIQCGQAQVMALLEYVDARAFMASRFIEFYGFKRSAAGDPLIVGWSSKSEAMRTYRFDRVVGVASTIIPYKARYPINLNII